MSHFNQFISGRGLGRGHYDQYGNFIPGERPQNLFAQYILQAVSDTVRSALHNLSDQIEYKLTGGDVVDNEPQYVIIRYKNMPNKKENTSCPICFDEYDDSSMVSSTKCLHFFHKECLKKWIDVNKTCPICRTDL